MSGAQDRNWASQSILDFRWIISQLDDATVTIVWNTSLGQDTNHNLDFLFIQNVTYYRPDVMLIIRGCFGNFQS
ncbi:hypothetical protein HCEG_05014 [Histoplasma capsulatum var. duboisii H88]|uniref:Uncharacterized protein n=2 Tax=Ajellomyces capsulatus TaxID=5037 RepID=F0UJQ6_AJEC8|nr:hypothetical protein HCDG_00096 [Histoplasma capsulatum H143]EGC45799.1 hypothetical protein HCEG_05014 [Histoplasma capsulatum var. duboisii H88]